MQPSSITADRSPLDEPGGRESTAAATRVTSGWEASLELSFSPLGRRTVVSRRRHRGPLVVQRPFHEPDGSCQTYLVHPPGGIVGGDRLSLSVLATPGARALLTTPAATKLYRSATEPSTQRQTFSVRAGATLEWLPQETIAYDGTHSSLDAEIDLEPGAQYVGWEVLCLGEHNRGLARGRVTQRFELRRDGRPVWCERADLRGGSPLLEARFGLCGRPVLGTLVASGATPALLDAVLERWPGAAAPDAALAPRDWLSASLLGEVIVCRYLGYSAEAAKAAFRRAWQLIRPAVIGRPARAPRVWST